MVEIRQARRPLHQRFDALDRRHKPDDSERDDYENYIRRCVACGAVGDSYPFTLPEQRSFDERFFVGWKVSSMSLQFAQSKLVVALSGLAAGALFAPLVGRGVRPLVRLIVKGGIVAQRELLVIVEGLREELQDIVAEAKAELGDLSESADGEEVHASHHAHAHERAGA
ncbi:MULTISPECIES: DUF5132 domain-containing protein [Sorangium]|nr:MULTISPECIES: DUF5132 domain-containing protein [Sorangium]